MKRLFPVLRLAPIPCGICSFVFSAIGFSGITDGKNYFSASAPWGTLAYGFTLLGILLTVIGLIAVPKEKCPELPFPKDSAFYLFPALGFGCAGVLILLNAGASLFGLICSILLLFSFLFSVFAVFSEKLIEFRNLLAFLGFFAVVSTLFLNAFYYFDTSVEMNSSFKLCVQFGLLAATVFYTTEIRCFLGEQAPRLHLALAGLTVSVGGLSGLSVPIALLAGTFTHTSYLAGSAVVLGASALAALRLIRSVLAVNSLPQPDPIEETEESIQE